MIVQANRAHKSYSFVIKKKQKVVDTGFRQKSSKLFPWVSLSSHSYVSGIFHKWTSKQIFFSLSSSPIKKVLTIIHKGPPRIFNQFWPFAFPVQGCQLLCTLSTAWGITVFTDRLFDSHLENQKIGGQKRFPWVLKKLEISRTSLSCPEFGRKVQYFSRFVWTLRQALHEIPFNPNTSVQRCLNPLLHNERHLFLLPHLYQRISQPSGQDKKW